MLSIAYKRRSGIERSCGGRHFWEQRFDDVCRLLLRVPLFRCCRRIRDPRLLEGREEEVSHDERVTKVSHHRVVLSVHDLLVGKIKKAKPVLAERNLCSNEKKMLKQ